MKIPTNFSDFVSHTFNAKKIEPIKRVKELVRPFHRDPRFINMFLTERKSRRKPTVKWIVTDEFIACVTLLAVWIRAVTEVVVPLGAKGALHMLVPDEKKSVAK